MELPVTQSIGQHICFLIMRSSLRILGSEKAILYEMLRDFSHSFQTYAVILP